MTFTVGKYIKKDEKDFIFEVNEKIKWNEAFGDQIGLSCDNGNILWFDESIDLENEDVQEFIENFFTKPISVALLIGKKISRGL